MVMLLQTARYLVKAAQQAREGTVSSSMVEYLLDSHEKISTIGRGADRGGTIPCHWFLFLILAV